jgi:hypothetical protein
MLEVLVADRKRGTHLGKGDTRDIVGSIFGVAGGYVQRAKAVRESSPAMFASIFAGDLTISDAEGQLAVVTASAAKALPGLDIPEPSANAGPSDLGDGTGLASPVVRQRSQSPPKVTVSEFLEEPDADKFESLRTALRSAMAPKVSRDLDASSLVEMASSGWHVVLIPPCVIQRATHPSLPAGDRVGSILVRPTGEIDVVATGISYDHGFESSPDLGEAVSEAFRIASGTSIEEVDSLPGIK